MKTLALVLAFATVLWAKEDKAATQRVFGAFADADLLAVQRGALCHEHLVKLRTLEEVNGEAEVRAVLSQLVVELKEPIYVPGEDGQEGGFLNGVSIIACPDYTLSFSRRGKPLGAIGLIGVSTVKAPGETADRYLTDESRVFLKKRFGLLDEPTIDEAKKKKANQPPQPTPVNRRG